MNVSAPVARFLALQALPGDNHAWKVQSACMFLDMGLTPEDVRRPPFAKAELADLMAIVRGEEAKIRRSA